AMVLSAMAWLIGVASLIILELTVRAFGPLGFAPDDAWVARAGLVLLTLACLLGALITVVGEGEAAAGRPPEFYGAAGVLKFPHGVPLHALQVLFVQGWLMRRLKVPLVARRRSLQWVTAGLVLSTAYAIVQTAMGGPRFPPVNMVTTGLAGLAAFAFVAGGVRAFVRR
ncbi:MAG: hypothetical protein AAFV29_05760, partial [Myxococcota bacterium]